MNAPTVRRGVLAALLLLFLFTPTAGQEPHVDGRGDITFALTGDAIITRALRPYREPEYTRMVELLRGATVAYTNLEVLFHEYGPDIIPAEASGGTYMAAEPALADELAWAGFDMVSRANNHTMDYGVGGMRATTRAVEAAGLAHAGAGENLARALAPAYLETPGGRVALISVASTFAEPMRAGEQRRDVRGRPGLAPVRHSTRYLLPPEPFDQLRSVARSMGRSGGEVDRLRFMGETFVRGDTAGVETVAHAGDLTRLTAAIDDAKRQANWVVVSSHSHERWPGDRHVPAQFVQELARAAVDAGADIVVMHGPHVLRGIEVRDGKPIFYSLANFIFQNETVAFQPADNYESRGLGPDALPGLFYDERIDYGRRSFPADPAYWESVIASVRFDDAGLADITLHPITLGHGLPRPQRGRPLLAPPEHGRRVIEQLDALSRPFGARVVWERDVGKVRF
jgi:poly-gamma-glutamate synthesis protein (capsule biosynthesis protein)